MTIIPPNTPPELVSGLENELEDIVAGLLINGIPKDQITYTVSSDFTEFSVYIGDTVHYQIVAEFEDEPSKDQP